MRESTNVIYELILNSNGEEITEIFSHNFDSSIYNADIDGTDFMMVNFKVQELKVKYGEDLMLMEFSVERQ